MVEAKCDCCWNEIVCGRRIEDVDGVVIVNIDADALARARIDEGAAIVKRRIINKFILEERSKTTKIQKQQSRNQITDFLFLKFNFNFSEILKQCLLASFCRNFRSPLTVGDEQTTFAPIF